MGPELSESLCVLLCSLTLRGSICKNTLLKFIYCQQYDEWLK